MGVRDRIGAGLRGFRSPTPASESTKEPWERVGAADRDIGGQYRADGFRQSKAYHEWRYAGAELGRRADGWSAGSSSADAEDADSEPHLRNRARSLVRDNPYAANIVNTIADYTVSDGIRPIFQNDADTKQWEEWQKNADATGNLSFYSQQHVIARAIPESGSILIRRRTRRPDEGLVVPFQIELLEIDFLDVSRVADEKTAKGRRILNGRELNRRNQVTAYYLFDDHPGDEYSYTSGQFESRRVPAKDIIEAFHPGRPNQTGGKTWLAPAMMNLWKLGRYLEHDLERVQKTATQLGVVKRMTGQSGPMFGGPPKEGSGTSKPRTSTWAGGVMNVVYPDEDVEWFAPPISANFDSYVQTMLMGISGIVSIPYALLSGDTSGLSWSILRGVNLRFKQRIRSFQHTTMVDQVCRGVVQWYSEAAQMMRPVNGVKRKGIEVREWQLPRFEEVDRMKEAQADILELRAGLETMRMKLSERGHGNMKAHLSEIAGQEKRLADLELILDGQTRHVSRQGQAHGNLPWEEEPEPDEPVEPEDSEEEEDDAEE